LKTISLSRKNIQVILVALTFCLGFFFTGCDGTVELKTYNISGEIVTGEGVGIEGVSLHFENGFETVTTDEDGKWTKSGLVGTVTITPVKADWTFDPVSQDVENESNKVNFVGTEQEVTYSVSGTIEDKTGAGIEGVKISFSGDLNPVFTESDGTWVQTDLVGTVTITPEKDGWVFDPLIKEVSGEDNSVDFLGLGEFTITIMVEGDGTVTPEEGVHFFKDGDKVVFEAFGGTGWVFKEWLGDFTGKDNPVEIVIEKDFEITAVFEIGHDEETGFAGGDGTEENPFRVGTPEQLSNIRENLDENFLQIADIDLADYLSEKAWDPIGGEFDGSFDGNGFKIKHLGIPENFNYYRGLFYHLGENAIIKNIALEDINLNGYLVVGGIAGRNYGKITGSYVTGEIYGWHPLGGLVGENFGEIKDCYTDVSINGAGEAGGLVGINKRGGIISGSFSLGSLDISGHFVGGLVGQNSGEIRNSFTEGDVKGNERVGGLVGDNPHFPGYDPGLIKNSYSIGEVTGNNQVGGLVGSGNGIVTNSYWDIVKSKQEISAGGEGRTTLQMQVGVPGEYIKPAGTVDEEEKEENLMYYEWDYMIWDFGTSNDFPWLKWENW